MASGRRRSCRGDSGGRASNSGCAARGGRRPRRARAPTSARRSALLNRDGFDSLAHGRKRAEMASSGSAKSLHAGGGSAPFGGEACGSTAPSRRAATAPPEFLPGSCRRSNCTSNYARGHGRGTGSARLPGPLKLAGCERRLILAGRGASGNARNSPARLRPGRASWLVSTPPSATLLYIERDERPSEPARSQPKCSAGSTRRLSPTRIELIDDSEPHRGHGGYNPAGESHFTLRIESPAFAGKSPGRAAAPDPRAPRRPDARARPCAVDPGDRARRMSGSGRSRPRILGSECELQAEPPAERGLALLLLGIDLSGDGDAGAAARHAAARHASRRCAVPDSG